MVDWRRSTPNVQLPTSNKARSPKPEDRRPEDLKTDDWSRKDPACSGPRCSSVCSSHWPRRREVIRASCASISSTWRAGRRRCSSRPSGQSMLVDAGWPGADRRDALRIAAAARDAGVTRIDYLITTHYHMDHVGGVPNVAAILPVGTFVDHGDSVERDGDQAALLTAYANARGSSGHLIAKAGRHHPRCWSRRARHLGRRGRSSIVALPGGGDRESAVRQFPAKGDRYGRKRPVGGHADYLWQVPHDRSRGSHVERRTPARMPGQPDWPRGSVPHDASWLRQVGTGGRSCTHCIRAWRS